MFIKLIKYDGVNILVNMDTIHYIEWQNRGQSRLISNEPNNGGITVKQSISDIQKLIGN